MAQFTPRRKLLLNGAVLLFALVGGLAATLSAMNAMLSSEFSAPCYAGLLGWQQQMAAQLEGLVVNRGWIQNRLDRQTGMTNDSELACEASCFFIGQLF
jgi:hypothetical protein